ncbi:MAG: amino acid-binding protein [Clostridiales bacterium]|nr:amino acid-binding protein [Clostridiales bacterium]MCD8370048.1 amino acid-binding protein [Clostridiales bacterium]
MLKQVSIFGENSKGTFQKITAILQQKGINIWGSVTNDSAEFGIIRMVVSDPDLTWQALTEAGYMTRLNSILGIEMNDEVGSLNKLLLSLSESNININYMYLSFNRDSGMPVMVVHTDDIWEVQECLKAKGYSIL